MRQMKFVELGALTIFTHLLNGQPSLQKAGETNDLLDLDMYKNRERQPFLSYSLKEALT